MSFKSIFIRTFAPFSLTFFALFLAAFIPRQAQAQVYDGQTATEIEFNQVIDQIEPGDVLVIGEYHGFQSLFEQQMSILKALRERGLKVSVGMEFFNYTDQSAIDQYRRQDITAAEFQKLIQWKGMDFNLYSPQLLFGEFGLGINMPRSVTSQISKNGLQSLSDDQKKLMPPDFQLGSEAYKRRFFEAMGGHVSGAQFDNYFAAQSVWDETMAWNTVKFMKDYSDHVFVIIVGEFHVAFNGGLPDRLQKRLTDAGLSNSINVKTISQLSTKDLSGEDIEEFIKPSDIDGKRADYIFLAP